MCSKESESGQELLKNIAKRVKLLEGDEGVRKILREIFRKPSISTKELSRLIQLPIPVTAAVRRELEKEELLHRRGGIVLTEKGEHFVRIQLGLKYSQRFVCQECYGKNIQVPNDFLDLLNKLRLYLKKRPKPLTQLDQSHGTPETALNRSVLMLEKGDVEGRRIIFLGDDDFTSIAVGMLKAAKTITVLDIDDRLLNTIQLISKEDDLGIECVKHDLRKPLTKTLFGKYDVVFTDPPYTITGLVLFLSRGITALQRKKSAPVYLSFAHQPPDRNLKLQKTLGEMGLVFTDFMPRFNVYEGSEMLANTTFLARLETTSRTRPLISEDFDEKLYTGEIKPTIRIYECTCSKKIKVGVTKQIQTIEELKEHGCPKCGEIKGFKLIKKCYLKESILKGIKLRNFKPSDFRHILEFEREIASLSFPQAPIIEAQYHREKLEKAVRRGNEQLKVALLDREIIGWLWLKIEKDRNTGEKFGYIKSIAVKPEYRHLGLGKKLSEATSEYLKRRGIKRVDLIVSKNNYVAEFFFEDNGFERVHSTMRKRIMWKE